MSGKIASRETPDTILDGSACSDCGWLVRRIQEDGSVRMEHAYNCRSRKNSYGSSKR